MTFATNPTPPISGRETLTAFIQLTTKGFGMELMVQAEAAVMPSAAVSGHVDSVVADVELQRRVQNFLLSRRVPRTSRLRIAAHAGVVTLHGTHRSFYHKQLCINCCLRVAGVVRLVDATRVEADS